MIKIRIYSIILFSLILLILFSLYYKKKEKIKINVLDKEDPTYRIEYSDTLSFNQKGLLSYRLTSQYSECFSQHNFCWFIQPSLTIYNCMLPAYSIRSDRAKLISNHILNLYGHVEFNALTIDNLRIRRIITDNAQINLITKDINSQDPVEIYGIKLYSTGLRMRGNLHNQYLELIENVITSYEIKNN